MADLLSIAIPFLFVLAVVYGALEVSDIFKKKQVKLIISLCFALVAMTTEFIVEFIMSIIPLAIPLFIAIFFIGFLLSFFRGKGGEGGGGPRDYVLVAIVLMLILLFAANYNLSFLSNLLPGISQGDFMTGIGILIVLIFFYAIYKVWNPQKQG
jgi:hypothetical protein